MRDQVNPPQALPGGYQCVLFDFDGVLFDTAPGILATYSTMIEQLGLPTPAPDELRGFIGPPIIDIYQNYFHLPAPAAAEATRRHRALYGETGLADTVLYPGIAELLRGLRAQGVRTGVASLKYEPHAMAILNRHRMTAFFDVIQGQGEQKCSKADAIRTCLDVLRIPPEKAVLVGDTPHDGKGAAQTGVAFIAALFGYGFHTPADAAPFSPVSIVENAAEIGSFLSL